MKDLSEEKLEAILKRCEATTQGPWRSFVEGRDHTSGSSFIMTGVDSDRGPDLELSGGRDADLDFIANAKQDVPLLIAEIRRLRVMANR